jgi:hypothetical protein
LGPNARAGEIVDLAQTSAQFRATKKSAVLEATGDRGNDDQRSVAGE